MRIESLEFCDNELGWKLDPIYFSDLILLVGISGVGKTQILGAISHLKRISDGTPLNGVQWDITFLTENNSQYRWQGEFENNELFANIFYEEDVPADEIDGPQIIYEKLFLNENLIIDRDKSRILFNGIETPKLSPFQSAVEILKRNDDIAPAHIGFKKIIHNDHPFSIFDETPSVISFTQFDDLEKRLTDLELIQENNFPIAIKLALTYINAHETFKKIKSHFIDIFPQVEDVKIDLTRYEVGLEISLSIKEKGVKNWINQRMISSGMLRSITYISQLYLLPEGSVILIDEIENSLGVNCIDILTDLLAEHRKLQFVITSHHPYIINNIGIEHWKIVTRKGGIVTATDASEFNLGKSRHDAFIQLINLEAYSEGITA